MHIAHYFSANSIAYLQDSIAYSWDAIVNSRDIFYNIKSCPHASHQNHHTPCTSHSLERCEGPPHRRGCASILCGGSIDGARSFVSFPSCEKSEWNGDSDLSEKKEKCIKTYILLLNKVIASCSGRQSTILICSTNPFCTSHPLTFNI